MCEPVDLPVNKRHFEMVYAHLKYSDKPFMGSATRPERAEDSVRICELLFGEAFVRENTVMTSLINANSPLVWDLSMLGAAEVYARSNQACIITPFNLRRHEPGLGRRDADSSASRGDGGNRVLPAHPSRRARGVWNLRLDAVDAVRRADLRHARGGAGDLWRRPTRATDEHALPHRRLALRLEGPRRAGRL